MMYRITLYRITPNEDKYVCDTIATREWGISHMYGYLHAIEKTQDLLVKSKSVDIITVDVNRTNYEIRLEQV